MLNKLMNFVLLSVPFTEQPKNQNADPRSKHRKKKQVRKSKQIEVGSKYNGSDHFSLLQLFFRFVCCLDCVFISNLTHRYDSLILKEGEGRTINIERTKQLVFFTLCSEQTQGYYFPLPKSTTQLCMIPRQEK